MLWYSARGVGTRCEIISFSAMANQIGRKKGGNTAIEQVANLELI